MRSTATSETWLCASTLLLRSVLSKRRSHLRRRRQSDLTSFILQSIALQTRHILEEMNTKGHQVDSIYMSGASSLTNHTCRHNSTDCSSYPNTRRTSQKRSTHVDSLLHLPSPRHSSSLILRRRRVGIGHAGSVRRRSARATRQQGDHLDGAGQAGRKGDEGATLGDHGAFSPHPPSFLPFFLSCTDAHASSRST